MITSTKVPDMKRTVNYIETAIERGFNKDSTVFGFIELLDTSRTVGLCAYPKSQLKWEKLIIHCSTKRRQS